MRKMKRRSHVDKTIRTMSENLMMILTPMMHRQMMLKKNTTMMMITTVMATTTPIRKFLVPAEEGELIRMP
jgi:hypothetical protein